MDMYIKKGKKVFVHCHAGMGRTGIVCAAYMIYSKMSLNMT
jgi:protein tyrosine phosphatase domain-containing protein 1